MTNCHETEQRYTWLELLQFVDDFVDQDDALLKLRILIFGWRQVLLVNFVRMAMGSMGVAVLLGMTVSMGIVVLQGMSMSMGIV